MIGDARLPRRFWRGYISIRGKRRRAHRVAYEALVGPIPEGAVLDHVVCDRPSCCNPSHVEPTSHARNILRSPVTRAARNAAKTHCPQGHPYSGKNLFVTRCGRRRCRRCNRERQRRYAKERKNARKSAFSE